MHRGFKSSCSDTWNPTLCGMWTFDWSLLSIPVGPRLVSSRSTRA
ncbi:hypothetical protein L249_4149 [Ophiocordyceps polyrhachis-furcata BCC 54312]|uniref:Uncharacterized protein n=1 Tax=Ophiocordyceps polyrhachis-furcata BCC 54312 TaxID=1330021 RepID=A0A367L594_9HYPO|nr:hypothetical protein L249_4149 [Ophiocordyceps polyrhachis-furcata BCC 54312]